MSNDGACETPGIEKASIGKNRIGRKYASIPGQQSPLAAGSKRRRAGGLNCKWRHSVGHDPFEGLSVRMEDDMAIIYTLAWPYGYGYTLEL